MVKSHDRGQLIVVDGYSVLHIPEKEKGVDLVLGCTHVQSWSPRSGGGGPSPSSWEPIKTKILLKYSTCLLCVYKLGKKKQSGLELPSSSK